MHRHLAHILNPWPLPLNTAKRERLYCLIQNLRRVILGQTRKEKPGGWKRRMDRMLERAGRTKDGWMTVGRAQWR